MDLAQRGGEALSASDFPTAIKEYTRALVVHPHAPDYYIKRSTAYSRLKPENDGPNFTAALQDAEMAVAIGLQRGRREPILHGQMRRAVVLYQLGKLGDAKYIFGIVRGKVGQAKRPMMAEALQQANAGGDGDDKSSKDSHIARELDMWEMKLQAKVANVDPSDESMQVTVKEIPDGKVPDQEALKKMYQSQVDAMIGDAGKAADTAASKTTLLPGTNASGTKSKEPSGTGASPPAASTGVPGSTDSASQPSGPTKVRHEWYQSSDTVTITLYAKGIPKDNTYVDISEDSVYISFPLPSGSDCAFTLDPLYGAVDASASKHSIMSTKMEISLRKKQPGQKWAALEGSEGSAAASVYSGAQSNPASSGASAPAYPTSSRKGVKDWDKVASSLREKKKKSGDKDKESGDQGEAEDGDDSDASEYGGDPVDGFFKKLYAKADPDTQRAMVKSFYESEGTALNTNWSEVGKKKVEVHPPSED